MNDPRDIRLERALRDATPDQFARGFGDRVAARLQRESAIGASPGALDFTASLQRNFVRIVPILAAASILLGVYSWWGGRATSSSVIDATLRLPQVSIASAYTPEALYGDAGGDN
jgi:hypothetical protein